MEEPLVEDAVAIAASCWAHRGRFEGPDVCAGDCIYWVNGIPQRGTADVCPFLCDEYECEYVDWSNYQQWAVALLEARPFNPSCQRVGAYVCGASERCGGTGVFACMDLYCPIPCGDYF